MMNEGPGIFGSPIFVMITIIAANVAKVFPYNRTHFGVEIFKSLSDGIGKGSECSDLRFFHFYLLNFFG